MASFRLHTVIGPWRCGDTTSAWSECALHCVELNWCGETEGIGRLTHGAAAGRFSGKGPTAGRARPDEHGIDGFVRILKVRTYTYCQWIKY
jgi:hypothetical protein